MTIFVLAQKVNMTMGHGESGYVIVLGGQPYREDQLYPAFQTREAAEEFRKGLGYTSMKIYEMELK
jgi:hypothetical protein